jgi:hypothetical protein
MGFKKNALQSRIPASRVYFCSLFQQSVAEGGIDPKLILFSDEALFHLQGYTNTKSNRYSSTRNPYLTHQVLLHPVIFGVCVL